MDRSDPKNSPLIDSDMREDADGVKDEKSEQEVLKRWDYVIYTISLALLLVLSLGMFGYSFVLLVEYGFDTSGAAENDLDAEIIINFVTSLSQCFVFVVGMKARKSLDDVEQYRFATFLKVLTELYIFLLVFFIVCFLTFGSSEKALEIFGTVSLVYTSTNIVWCGLMYLKAKRLETICDLKRKRFIESLRM